MAVLLMIFFHPKTSEAVGAAAGITAAVVILIAYVRYQPRDRTEEAPYVHPSQLFALAMGILEENGSAEALQRAVQTTARLLGLAHVELRFAFNNGHPGMRSSYGCRCGPTLMWPLVHRGERLGWLTVSPRPTSEVTARRRVLLDEFVSGLATTAHLLRIRRTVEHRAQGMAMAQEELCRVLQRELHDVLGPTLATVTMRIDSARALLVTNPEASDTMLAHGLKEARTAVADVRRLVHELRPSELEGRDLMCALRAQSRRFQDASGGRLKLRVEGNNLPPFSNRLESAAYRIVCEAMTNVVRHSGARLCEVRLTVADGPADGPNGGLVVEVTDDGVGLPESVTPGLGLNSMRDRARELGGEFSIERRRPRGTRIVVRLPLERR